jgi:hypothetical protein
MDMSKETIKMKSCRFLLDTFQFFFFFFVSVNVIYSTKQQLHIQG